MAGEQVEGCVLAIWTDIAELSFVEVVPVLHLILLKVAPSDQNSLFSEGNATL